MKVIFFKLRSFILLNLILKKKFRTIVKNYIRLIAIGITIRYLAEISTYLALTILSITEEDFTK